MSINVFIRSRHDIKKHLRRLIDLTSSERFMAACNATDDLTNSVYQYYTTRGLPYEKPLDAIKSIKFSLEHGRFPSWIQQRVRKKTDKFIATLNEPQDEPGSLKLQLTSIADELEDDFAQLITTCTPDSMDVILDDFMALRKCSKNTSSYGSSVFEKYRQMMKMGATCKADLLQVPLQKPEKKGTTVIPTDVMKSLKSSFGPFYSSLADVIVELDKPPETKTKKEKHLEDMFDLDDVELAAERAELLRLITKENWTLENAARHRNMTVQEAIEILGLDQDEED